MRPMRGGGEVPAVRRVTRTRAADNAEREKHLAKQTKIPRQWCESLETRQMLSAANPTDVEQYVIELINRARANPAAEAKRLGIDLNEGLASGTISSAPRQPVAVNPYLTDAARDHSQWMID